MSLVSDLIDETVDGSTDLSQVLRRALVLASELRSEELRSWAQAELDGYADDVEIPDYRQFNGSNFGSFVGSFGRSARNIPVQLYNLTEGARSRFSKLELRSGVAALQEMYRSDGDYREQWSADAIARFSSDIYKDMTMIDAYKVIPKADVAAVIDAARNRLLNFVLELKQLHPEVETADGDLRSIPKEDVKVSVINHIYGSHNVLASGGTVRQEIYSGIEPGDLGTLISALKEASLPEDIINELPAAIQDDEAERTSGIGPRVARWLASVGDPRSKNSENGCQA